MMKIEKGDLISKSKPFAYVISSKLRGVRCDACLKRNSCLKKCTNCKLAYYCNRECQIACWKDHKEECKCFRRVHPRIPPVHVLLIARIIDKLSREEGKESETIGNVTRTFADLMSHAKEMESDALRLEVFEVSYRVLVQFIGRTVSSDEVFDIMGKLFINSITVMDEGEAVATGLYLGASAFNHACRPNVLFVFDGPQLLLRSTEDHDEFDINKLFVSYVDFMDPREQRRKQLSEQYYFRCNCSVCNDDTLDQQMHSMRCETRNCDKMIFLSADECAKCKRKVGSNRKAEATALMNSLQQTVDRSEKLKLANDILMKNEEGLTRGTTFDLNFIMLHADGALRLLEPVVRDAETVLHPFNVFFIKGADEVLDICITKGDIATGLSFGLASLNGYRKYYGLHHPSTVYLMAKVGKIQYNLHLYEEATRNMTEAIKQATFTFGFNHHITQAMRNVLH